MARRRPEATVNPARGAALVVVAVLVGLVLLREGIGDSNLTSSSRGDGVETTDAGAATDEGTDTATDEGTDEGTTDDSLPEARDPSQVSVVVLNGTSVNGAAGKFTTAIESAGYQMLEAGNVTTRLPNTLVYFTAGYDAEAAAVALAINVPATVTPTALPAPPPSANVDIAAANVVVIVGADIASSTPTTVTTAAGADTEGTDGTDAGTDSAD